MKARKMIDFGIDGPDRVRYLGINAKMNEFQAAMGLCVLDDIEKLMRNVRNCSEHMRLLFNLIRW